MPYSAMRIGKEMVSGAGSPHGEGRKKGYRTRGSTVSMCDLNARAGDWRERAVGPASVVIVPVYTIDALQAVYTARKAFRTDQEFK